MNLDFINNIIAFIMSIFTALTGGAGADLSSMSSTNEQVQTSQQSPSPKPPTNGGRKPDADGCVYGTPDYWQCKQDKSPVGKKNPPLSPSERNIARQYQFDQLVSYRNKSNRYYGPISRSSDLDRSAQAFAETLANTPGNRIWHSSYPGLENVAIDEIGYKNFINIFSNSPTHASNMLTRGNDVKVGIGIAQDPVTGSYFCVQQYKVN